MNSQIFIKNSIIINKNIKIYLKKKHIKEIIELTRKPNTKYSNIYKLRKTKQNKLLANIKEKKWGNKINKTKNKNQWSSQIGEYIVKYIFELKNIKIWRPKKINNYLPDWETNEYIIEVKTRNWTTTGTIGEKVFGVPYKYSDLPRLYNKKLIIICVAYQEYELTYCKNKETIVSLFSQFDNYVVKLYK